MGTPPTLLHQLEHRLGPDGDRVVVRFLHDDGAVETQRSLRELVERSRLIAADLQHDAGLQRGDRVVLCYGPSLDFIEAFLGCLWAGVIPAPLLPPDPFGSDVERLQRVCEGARARAVLTNRAYQRGRMLGRLGRIARLRAATPWPDLPWIVTDARRTRRAPRIELPSPDDLAFLQYTSGSTGTPRGIRVKHGNLAHNLAFVCEANTLGAGASMCSWLPQYHDMGLIGCALSTLWAGGALTMMSPFAFLKKPVSWLTMMHRYGATHTACPNFALELVARRADPAELASIDLSRVEVIACGAEPIHPDTVDRFYRAMAPTGLRAESFSGSYGLAETVVGVANRGRSRLAVDPNRLSLDRVMEPSAAADAVTVVGCGKEILGTRIRIVAPETREVVPAGHVGEIWVHSASVCDGYEGDDEATRRVFGARLSPDDGRAWLRTGDLGAVVDGELYPTGRLKELIIVRGRNVLPHDVEEAARRCHGALRPGGIAAFGAESDDGSEALAMLVELRDEVPDAQAAGVVREVRRAVAAAVGVPPAVVVVGRKGLVPKTTSGKTRRVRCREMLTEAGFAAQPWVVLVSREGDGEDVADPSEHQRVAAERTLESLVALVSAAVGRPLDEGALDAPIGDLGLDSVRLMELSQRIETALRQPVPADAVLSARSIRDLGRRLGLTADRAERPPVLRTWSWERVAIGGHPGVVGVVGDPLPAIAQEGIDVRSIALGGDYAGIETLVLRCAGDAEADIERCRALAAQLARSAHPPIVVVSTAPGASGGGPSDAASGLVWGFVRSLRSEQPAPRWRVRAGGPLTAAALADLEPELVLGDGAWAPRTRDAAAAAPPGVWAGHALVVGGLSPRGRRASLWLAQNWGVERLVLLDAAAPDPQAIEHIQSLEAAGVEVVTVVGEPQREEDVRAALAHAPSLRWAVLCAESAEEGPAERQTRARVVRAWQRGPVALEVLHRACDRDALLLVLADADGLVGPPQRAAGSASGAAMAALVTSIAGGGRQAVFVGYGPRVGEVNQRDVRRVWEPLGVGVLPDDDSLPLLDRAVASSAAVVGVWTSAR
ncbi:MAG: AMP-binding protein [Myxococcales bacterium]|nr:AMP-binding protein [Myxococcales bacterium]